MMQPRGLHGQLWEFLLARLGGRTMMTLALLLALLGAVAYGIADVVRGLDFTLLWGVGALALLLGWTMAKSRLKVWQLAALAIALGALLLLLRIGRLDRLLWELLKGGIIYLETGIQYLVSQVRAGRAPELAALPPDPTLLSIPWQAFVDALGALLGRVELWLAALLGGQPTFDPVAASLMWGLILWLAAVWAGWVICRWANVVRAVTPVGVLLALTLSYAWASAVPLLVMTSFALLLMAMVSQTTRELHWEQHAVDYSQDLRTDILGTVALLTLGLMGLALIAPSFSIQNITNFLNKITEERDKADAGPTIAESLGLEQQPLPANPTTIDRARTGGLPRRHLIGSGPDLQRIVVMLIRTGELAPMPPEQLVAGYPHHYWRSATYDQYSGQGWYASKTLPLTYEAGATAQSASQPYRRLLREEIQWIGESNGLIHAPGDIVAVDQPYEVAWRTNGDMFAASTEAIAYRADTFALQVTAEQLRAAGTTYPEWVFARYLQLPERMPERVLTLARDLTATAPTPYDRAAALERYLRESFPYTTDLPAPPHNLDIADYFLFELKKGYCDYYATAMAVLARAAGLPARLVIGYATGTYDAMQARYIITEADAHAWVEIYFPEYGWIPFEPTGGRPLLERAAAADEPMVWPTPQESLRPPQTETRTGPTLGQLLLYLSGGVVGAAALLVLLAELEALTLFLHAPEKTPTLLYRRLRKLAAWLHVPLRAGDTPYEFVAAFDSYVQRLAQNRQFQAWALPAAAELGELAELYVRRWYTAQPATNVERRAAIALWRRLRWRLILLWFWRRYRRRERVLTAEELRRPPEMPPLPQPPLGLG